MTGITFSKILSANDTGRTGGHQGGILVPKGEPDLLAFFPRLDPEIENPEAWITATDADGETLRLRYIWYNRKRHGTGTRDEYRITWLTTWLKASGAAPGDALVFRGVPGSGHYRIHLEAAARPPAGASPGGIIRLSGWRRVH